MELTHLECFLALADDLHFGRAAQRLQIGTPALSKRIGDLELQLGVRLFDRTSRRVALTPQGSALVEPAQRTLREFEAFLRLAEQAKAGTAGSLRIAYSPDTGESLTILVRALAESVPSVVTLPHLDVSHRVVEAVVRGDVALGIARVRPVPGLERMVLTRSLMKYVLMPLDHELTAFETVRLEQLLQADVLVPAPVVVGSNPLVPAAQMAMAPGARVVDVSSEAELWDMVARGLGVLVTNERSLQRHPRNDLAVRTLIGRVGAVQEYLVWRADDESPLTARAVDLARAQRPAFDALGDDPVMVDARVGR